MNFHDFTPNQGSHFIVRILLSQLFTPANELTSENTSTEMRIDLLKLNQLGLVDAKIWQKTSYIPHMFTIALLKKEIS